MVFSPLVFGTITTTNLVAKYSLLGIDSTKLNFGGLIYTNFKPWKFSG